MSQTFLPGSSSPADLVNSIPSVSVSPQIVEMRSVDDLVPYARNARIHSTSQISLLRSSLREFGFVNPVLIDQAGNIIAGHGRILAAKAEGMTEVPCVLVEHLSDAQRRAYILADNRLAEMSGWDLDMVSIELGDIRDAGLDLTLTGFSEADLELEPPADADRAFAEGMRSAEHAAEDEEYREFVDKFKPKKTTDDCYTPEPVYNTVRDWAITRYGLEGRQIIRPFYPGGDYAHASYPDGCVVIDNPPFSILAEIVDFYQSMHIPFFLFAPGLTVLGWATRDGVCAVIAHADVVYENGASVNTSFLTNLDENKIVVTPELHEKVETASEQAQAERHGAAELPKYDYPIEVATAARLGWLAAHGESLEIRSESCAHIRWLDMQKEQGKAIFGSGFLLSERAAAERAAAERAAAERAAAERAAAERAAATVWTLSDRERQIIENLK